MSTIEISNWFLVWLQCSFSCDIRPCSWRRCPISHLPIDLASSLPYVVTVKSPWGGQVCGCWSCYFSRRQSSGNQLHPIYWKAPLYKKKRCCGQGGKRASLELNLPCRTEHCAKSRTTTATKTKEECNYKVNNNEKSVFCKDELHQSFLTAMCHYSVWTSKKWEKSILPLFLLAPM